MEMDAKKAAQPTWATVRYMISQIQYGGRITDAMDELMMDTYADKYFHAQALEKGYELYPGYNVPDCTEIAAFRQSIEQLPQQESPEIFGLHTNADLTFRTLQVRDGLSTIIETMPKSGAGSGGLSPEEIVDKTAEDLLSKVPQPFHKESTVEQLRKLPGGSSQPLTVHLRQEIDRLNIIVNLTRKTLQNLRLAIAGTIALSGDLVDALSALYNGRIPLTWLRFSWESATLGNWFAGLLGRFDQLHKWLNTGRPKGYWLTGFFNPQGFLTAMKQEVNRKHAADKWALDDVIMSSEVTHPPKDYENLREGAAEGVFVYGLFLDGCAWHGKENRLVDSEPKKLNVPLPVLYVTGLQAKDKKKDAVASTYFAPSYRIKKRTGQHYIDKFELRTEDPPTKWILRGVALLCSID